MSTASVFCLLLIVPLFPRWSLSSTWTLSDMDYRRPWKRPHRRSPMFYTTEGYCRLPIDPQLSEAEFTRYRICHLLISSSIYIYIYNTLARLSYYCQGILSWELQQSIKDWINSPIVQIHSRLRGCQQPLNHAVYARLFLSSDTWDDLCI